MVGKCLTNIDPRNREVYENLEIGKEYEIEEICVGSWYTDVVLKDPLHETELYNSVMFEIPCDWDYTQKVEDEEDYWYDDTHIIWDYT